MVLLMATSILCIILVFLVTNCWSGWCAWWHALCVSGNDKSVVSADLGVVALSCESLPPLSCD